MNRQIKFRGKRKDNGKWVFGDLVHNAFDGTSRNMSVGIKTDGAYPVEVIPETVGQFTGLQDKHGNDIYESDIMRSLTNMEAHIVFSPTYGFYAQGDDFIINPESFKDRKLIGNIHDERKDNV